MPMHKGLLPREGFVADPIFKLLGKTILNPKFLLPIILLARYTKKGEDLSILHPLAFSRLKTLFYFALARSLSGWYSDKVLNNWVDAKYDWKKEIVVVTGGAGGIGGAIVKAFAEMGVTVVVLDIQDMTFETPSHVHHFRCDVSSPEDVTATADKIRSTIGAPTVLINNAGVARGKTLLDATAADIQLTFGVNALAHYWTTRAFLPAMVAADHGTIVTVASYAAYLCVPNMVDYGAAKAAAMAFHEGLAAELATRYGAPRVRTVLVCQGHARTELFRGYDQDTPFLMPRLEPETVAEAVVQQVLTGRSGHVVVPVAGVGLTALRAMPHWYQIGLRNKSKALMARFAGRQVIDDPEQYLRERERAEKEKSLAPEESTVLVD